MGADQNGYPKQSLSRVGNLGKSLVLELNRDIWAVWTHRCVASRGSGSPRVKSYNIKGPYFRPAAFAEYEVIPGDRVNVTAVTRFDYTEETLQYDVAPRVGARYVLVDGPVSTVLKGGLGLFYQPPSLGDTLPELGYKGPRSSRAIHSLGR